jgi:hypothetical protein
MHTPIQTERVTSQCSSLGASFRQLLFRIQHVFSVTVFAGILAAGCRTIPYSEESFRKPFDAQRVAALARESYSVSWHTVRWAREDLWFAGFQPTILDWEVLFYLDRLSKRVSWIARDIEQNPASPRCASKDSYDIIAFDTTMLKRRYQPSSFRPYTNGQVQDLLRMLDEIASYYEVKAP